MKNFGPESTPQFEDKSEAAGLRWQESYASPALADFDNDGLLDLFFTTVYDGDQSVLYRNEGDWKFAEQPIEKTGVETANTYQAAWGDFDGDGFLDLVSGGRLFKNNYENGDEKNNWLKIKLVDPTHHPIIGSQVRITVGDRTITRQISCSTGQGNQNEMALHFGLGELEAEEVTAEVSWIGNDDSSERQSTHKVRIGKLNLIEREPVN